MSLPLPVLDDRRFADLVEEAKSLIPAYQPEWTDYNPSDPGIALIELFAWLAEMLIYRADQVPERHVRAFLQLVDPNADSSDDLDADVTTVISALRQEYRAVTATDFEARAREVEGVARARCVPLRDLSPASEQDRLLPQPAHVSVIVLPDSASGTDASTLPSQVADYLDPRRLITTRVDVVDPIWTPISVHVLVARPPDVRAEDVPGPIELACGALLDPLTGGVGEGWPFGRPVYCAELIAAIEGLSQVDHVVDIDLTSSCDGAEDRCVTGTLTIADNGRLIGMELGQQALPGPVTPTDVASSPQFLEVNAHVEVTLDQSVTASARPAVLHEVIRDVCDLAWPGRGWPPASGPQGTLDTSQITSAVTPIPGIATVQGVRLTADPPGRVTSAPNDIQSVTVGPLELIELTTDVSIVDP